MKVKINLSIFLFFSLLTCCVTQNKPNSNMKTKSCFSSESFEKLKKNIAFRISVSGMGKYYVTFPPEKGRVQDGVKRPAKNPDQVYDVYYEGDTQLIVFKSPKHHFSFHKESGLQQPDEVEKGLGMKLFCHLAH
ncbi:MAG: hypothetical protein ACI8YQ_001425 [Polaribacter sp.]|jgi:hypothetical protein